MMSVNFGKVRQHGFSLIELLIVVVVLGILAAIAIPAYMDYVKIGRRADGVASLSRIEVEQEKWRVTHTAYTSTLSDLGVSATSSDGHYAIAITAADGTSYTATATAQGAQTSDTGCTTLSLAYSAGNSTRTPAACWKK